MTQTIYITRNGLLEPLGQSQILPYLRGISKAYSITLISYEKDEDWTDTARVARQRAECETLGIRWLPQRFVPSPKYIAPALSMMRMVWLLLREIRGQDARLIHARALIPATVAWLAGRITRVPFIYDMRTLWPEELIAIGKIKRNSGLHKAMVTAERACLRDAGAVVSLTHAAVEYLNRAFPEDMADQRVAVIPTCADLDRFQPAAQSSEESVYGCLGTILSGWFRTDWLASFLAVAARRDPDACFKLTTRDDPDQIRAAIGGDTDLQRRISISPSSSDAVPKVLHGQLASVMFFIEGLSKIGSSPTRMAEVLGCGLPVVTNDGVGDVAKIVREYNVGVLAAGPAPDQMEAAWDELQELMRDPELAQRCRNAADEVFALKAGTKAFIKIYDDILRDAGEPDFRKAR